MFSNNHDLNYLNTIQNLKKTLSEKQSKLEALQEKTKKYLKRAQKLENLIKQNETEKTKILEDFQENTNKDNPGFSNMDLGPMIQNFGNEPNSNYSTLKLNEETIESLKQKINEANKLIQRLRNDQIILKKALSEVSSIANSNSVMSPMKDS